MTQTVPPPLPERRRPTELSLGRMFGVPVRAGYSWIAIIILVAWSVQATLEAGPAGWAYGFFAALMFFAGVLVHELSHSVIAIRLGIGVKQIKLMVFGGISELEHEAKRPWDEFAIAIAGPLSSLAIGIVFLVSARWFSGAEIVTTFRWIGWINVWLAASNLLPGIPLDGGRVLRAAVWKATANRVRATRIASRAGQVLGAIAMGGGMVVLAISGFDGIWLIFIGWLMFAAASVAYMRPFTDSDLLDLPVEAVMQPVHVYASPSADPATIDFGPAEVMPVMNPWGTVEGVVTKVSLAKAADRVRDVMLPLQPAELVEVGTTVRELLDRVRPDFNAVVMTAGEPVGVVRPRELTEASGRLTE